MGLELLYIYKPIYFGGYHRCHKAFVHFSLAVWLCIRTFSVPPQYTHGWPILSVLSVDFHITRNAWRCCGADCEIARTILTSILCCGSQPANLGGLSARCHRGHRRSIPTAQDTQQLRLNTNARIIEKEGFFSVPKNIVIQASEGRAFVFIDTLFSHFSAIKCV